MKFFSRAIGSGVVIFGLLFLITGFGFRDDITELGIVLIVIGALMIWWGMTPDKPKEADDAAV